MTIIIDWSALFPWLLLPSALVPVGLLVWAWRGRR